MIFMLIVAIFVILCFIFIALQKCYQELKEIKDMLRTNQLRELGDLLDNYAKKEAETE